ncbi:MAG: SMC-Scp complex subunit ScpB [Phycisphaeraceae bacterium]|nr:SMC-Scp complex subunit ScpB [Phycisphaeraceae bacterium]
MDVESTEKAESAGNPPLDAAVAPLKGHLEALLLSIDKPIPAEKAARALGLIPEEKPESKADAKAGDEPTEPQKKASAKRSAVIESAERVIERLVAALNGEYESTSRSFRIERIAGGLRVMTLPAFAPTLARFHKDRQQTRLSKAAVETLAIIAYRQPITRAELESIRGVSCGEVLKSLIDRHLIGIRGRAEELGRPLLYGTTRQFLDHFGLASTADLPSPEELKAAL